mmetsp:Transcript_69099/g.114859  ORF Transcript_69099/g.114859 Transcript_69099/m.114859 type:complete len:452 (-) Transcript_69099:435-1790(-)
MLARTSAADGLMLAALPRTPGLKPRKSLKSGWRSSRRTSSSCAASISAATRVSSDCTARRPSNTDSGTLLLALVDSLGGIFVFLIYCTASYSEIDGIAADATPLVQQTAAHPSRMLSSASRRDIRCASMRAVCSGMLVREQAHMRIKLLLLLKLAADEAFVASACLYVQPRRARSRCRRNFAASGTCTFTQLPSPNGCGNESATDCKKSPDERLPMKPRYEVVYKSSPQIGKPRSAQWRRSWCRRPVRGQRSIVEIQPACTCCVLSMIRSDVAACLPSITEVMRTLSLCSSWAPSCSTTDISTASPIPASCCSSKVPLSKWPSTMARYLLLTRRSRKASARNAAACRVLAATMRPDTLASRRWTHVGRTRASVAVRGGMSMPGSACSRLNGLPNGLEWMPAGLFTTASISSSCTTASRPDSTKPSVNLICCWAFLATSCSAAGRSSTTSPG